MNAHAKFDETNVAPIDDDTQTGGLDEEAIIGFAKDVANFVAEIALPFTDPGADTADNKAQKVGRAIKDYIQNQRATAVETAVIELAATIRLQNATLQRLVDTLAAPKRLVMDDAGKPVGVITAKIN